MAKPHHDHDDHDHDDHEEEDPLYIPDDKLAQLRKQEYSTNPNLCDPDCDEDPGKPIFWDTPWLPDPFSRLLAALAFVSLLSILSCTKPAPAQVLKCKTDYVHDNVKDSTEIGVTYEIDTTFVPTMRVQVNLIHHDTSFDFASRTAKVPAMIARLNKEFRHINIERLDPYVYEIVTDQVFTIDDIRGNWMLEDSIISKGFSECALNINIVPEGQFYNGYTIPGLYPKMAGNIVWVTYRVLDVKRPEWISTVPHEVSHALGENHLEPEGCPSPCSEVPLEHAQDDNLQSYSHMRDTFTIDQETRMYMYLIHRRPAWWDECYEEAWTN